MPKYDIRVTPQATFLADQSKPDEGHYVFAYAIQIHNAGEVTARLLSRHWIITDGNGDVQEVRGQGVVGEQPSIAPGETYRYSSGAGIATPVGIMHGTYQMLAEDGTLFNASIPSFTLSIPRVLH
jgi:ApaG protein